MSFYSDKGIAVCERCGHGWHSSKYDSKTHTFTEPRSCGKCKSKVWNQPRTYGGKYLGGNAPMARRFKPTGRAAKKEPKTIEDIYALAESPEERSAISKYHLIYELASMLEKVGIK